ncbi:SGNH/GDSL hydrolase family protein [Kitasatospora sp. NPDC092948]|uniref:SGNH/GDSL hydrolase family protein n=1 Tax=Kitasatospora sp. NPDC092948 TaxID=3364088 RepID=UPI00381C0FC6
MVASGGAAALAVCAAAGVSVGGGQARAAEAVPTVFIGDSYTGNYGIAPSADTAPPGLYCFRSQQNYPAVAARRLAERGVPLQVRADRSCASATVENFWTSQQVVPGTDLTVPPQQDALGADTRLVVGSTGGNTLGFVRILKQCSERLRGPEGALVPAVPVDADSPAGECRRFFASGRGREWLDDGMERVDLALEEMFDRIAYVTEEKAATVLVGYPRLVPRDVSLCGAVVPGTEELPFADIPPDALRLIDQVEARLNAVMAHAARKAGAQFVDLYAVTGNNTACDGGARGIGGLLEPSELQLGATTLPWYAHPNALGRDVQAEYVADRIAAVVSNFASR